MVNLRQKSYRGGFTLLEVLLATALLVIALSALSQLASNGTRAALRTELDTHAAMQCQSLLDELLAGSRPLTLDHQTTVAADSDWIWSAHLSDGPTETLATLAVTVSNPQTNPKATYRLQRIVSRNHIDRLSSQRGQL